MTTPSIDLQMLFLFLAGVAVTLLTNLVKRIVELPSVRAATANLVNVDSTTQKRIAAAIVTVIVYAVTHLFDLAPTLQQNLGAVVLWLGTTYGVAAGVYEHQPEKPDPAQLTSPRPKV